VRPSKWRTPLVLLALIGALAGCARQGKPELPSACADATAESVSAALVRAPADVRLGSTPLSSCLVRAAGAGDVERMGAVYVQVAGRLGDQARAHPGGAATTRLAYLVAAVQRGAGRTQGIYDELARRLDDELQGVDTNSPAYRRGQRAGSTSG
jgi:predicted small lipoprotein YifL